MIDFSQFVGHTPGPWHVRNGGRHWNNPVIQNWHVCWSEDGEQVVDHVYEEADARLIAAAPDLLVTVERQAAQIAQLRDALKDVLRIATAASMGVSGNTPRLDRARAALAQAQP